MSSSLQLQGEGLVWLIGAVVCLLATLRVNCLLAWEMDGRIMRCGIKDSADEVLDDQSMTLS